MCWDSRVIERDHPITILLINGGPWTNNGLKELTLDGKSLASVCIIGSVLAKSIDSHEYPDRKVSFDVD